MKQYKVNEIFYSIQGEGANAGRPAVFVRLSGCNMKCDVEASDVSPGGFACDTEFESGRMMTANEIATCAVCLVQEIHCYFMILTGGEPALQADRELIREFQNRRFTIAIETNGSINVDHLGLDYICVAPKVAEHAIKQLTAHEVRYVRGVGQAIPKTAVKAKNKYISPAFDGMICDPKTMEWCVQLVKENPTWRLSIQTHKFMKQR